MEYRLIDGTDLRVSILGYGAAPLGDVYGRVDLATGIRSVRAALELGVTVFDVAPYYGRTRAETVLGRALAGVDRDAYTLATKVGRYGPDEFDFSAARVRRSVDESLARLGAGHLDLVQVHDIEFGDLSRIVAETLPALAALRDAGKIRHLGVTGYPLAALAAVARRADLDTVLSYCRYTLLDRSLADWAPAFAARGVGVLNASPLAMGALTGRGAPPWHPAPAEVLRRCAAAAELCARRGAALEHLAVRFSAGCPGVATTFVGMPDERQARRNVRWALGPLDEDLLADVDRLLAPVRGRTWPSGRPENGDPA
ncbi:aldo/keto reductase [Amorphoplanes nipponensis]|uniref:Oxidoreductase n=1 Tax=Actinoplanes nipponensis TaxID=135950 RepID=A0A919JH34_9ACTN|nr:aldo/keto reductase [Actinoplanes nipponensis]GIE49081.1 oxidoreductase [Actinoplanes nipponensis]